MATQPIDPTRRVVLRRRRGAGGGGFSQGNSTVSESFRAPAEPEIPEDEVDDAVDPDQFQRRMRVGSPPPPVPLPDGRENPRSRLHQVALAGSAAYAKEFRLGLLHRLLMRRVPLDEIARQLQVSISTVEKDRAELKKMLREEARKLNVEEMVGNQNAFYDEVAGMALRIASQGSQRDEEGNILNPVPTAMKLAAMRTALAANADRSRFLNTAGVYDVLRFRKAEDGANVSDVQLLMQRTQEMLQQLMQDDEGDRPAGGFDPLTFDDADASSSQNEIESL